MNTNKVQDAFEEVSLPVSAPSMDPQSMQYGSRVSAASSGPMRMDSLGEI